MDVVFIDSNIMPPFKYYLRGFLLTLASKNLIKVRWSKHVLEEVYRNMEKAQSTDKQKMSLQKVLRDFPDAYVTGYEHLTPNLTLPDPNDVHVLAVAIYGEATILLTENIKHFSDDVTEVYGIDVQLLFVTKT